MRIEIPNWQIRAKLIEAAESIPKFKHYIDQLMLKELREWSNMTHTDILHGLRVAETNSMISEPRPERKNSVVSKATTVPWKANSPCFNFEKGTCTNGDQCRFLHTRRSVSATDKTVDCRDFQKGQCKFGDKCKFKHTEKTREPGVCKFFAERDSCAKAEGCNFKHVQLGRGSNPSQSPRRHQSPGDNKKGDAKNDYNRAATPSRPQGNVPKQGKNPQTTQKQL